MAKDGPEKEKWFLTTGSHCLVKRNWGEAREKGYGHVQVGVKEEPPWDKDKEKATYVFQSLTTFSITLISPLRRNRPTERVKVRPFKNKLNLSSLIMNLERIVASKSELISSISLRKETQSF